MHKNYLNHHSLCHLEVSYKIMHYSYIYPTIAVSLLDMAHYVFWLIFFKKSRLWLLIDKVILVFFSALASSAGDGKLGKITRFPTFTLPNGLASYSISFFINFYTFPPICCTENATILVSYDKTQT